MNFRALENCEDRTALATASGYCAAGAGAVISQSI